jgi:Cu+-exporting ATPase
LTEGKPALIAAEATHAFDREQMLKLAAGAESLSEHPIARAFLPFRDQSVVNNFQATRSGGVRATVDGRAVKIGTAAFVQADTTELAKQAGDWEKQARTVLFVAVDQRFAGIIAIADVIKANAREVVNTLQSEGLNVVLLTGDNRSTAEAVAEQLGIAREFVFAGVRPEEKAARIASLRANGGVAMVGDGLNDAPALTASDVGLALGTGTDLAKASADVVIATSDLRAIPRALKLGRATLSAIRQNLFWAFAYNTLGIPLAALGFFGQYGPLIAAIAMSMSSVTVVARSSLLARLKLD